MGCNVIFVAGALLALAQPCVQPPDVSEGTHTAEQCWRLVQDAYGSKSPHATRLASVLNAADQRLEFGTFATSDASLLASMGHESIRSEGESYWIAFEDGNLRMRVDGDTAFLELKCPDTDRFAWLSDAVRGFDDMIRWEVVTNIQLAMLLDGTISAIVENAPTSLLLTDPKSQRVLEAHRSLAALTAEDMIDDDGVHMLQFVGKERTAIVAVNGDSHQILAWSIVCLPDFLSSILHGPKFEVATGLFSEQAAAPGLRRAPDTLQQLQRISSVEEYGKHLHGRLVARIAENLDATGEQIEAMEQGLRDLEIEIRQGEVDLQQLEMAPPAERDRERIDLLKAMLETQRIQLDSGRQDMDRFKALIQEAREMKRQDK